MKVIGAGFGRTGTLSLKAALEELLGGRCYHMETVVTSAQHLGYWSDWAANPDQTPDWDTILDGFVAGVDAPITLFWEDLVHRFPEAKVVLTTREPDRWVRSFKSLMSVNIRSSWMGLFSKRARRFGKFGRVMGQRFIGSLKEDDLLAMFAAHNQRVRDIVPAERLVEMSVKDGWGPLCEHLGVEVPDHPFPHLNEGVATLKKAHWELAFGRRGPSGLAASASHGS